MRGHHPSDTSTPILDPYRTCIWKRSLPRFPRSPKALQCEKKHDGRREKHQKKTAGSEFRRSDVLTVFLDSGNNKKEPKSQKNPANTLQPESAKRPEKVRKNYL